MIIVRLQSTKANCSTELLASTRPGRPLIISSYGLNLNLVQTELRGRVMDFQQLRNKYESAGINESELPENPLDCLHDWFELAKKHRPGRWYEPNAMTLAIESGWRRTVPEGPMTVPSTGRRLRSDCRNLFFSDPPAQPLGLAKSNRLSEGFRILPAVAFLVRDSAHRW